MRKIMVVAVREYLVAVRSKAFVITILLMPLMMSSGFIADKFLGNASLDISDRVIAVVDRTGLIFDKLAAAAELRNAVDIFEDADGPSTPQQIAPRFVLQQAATSDQETDELLFDLSQRVRDKDLFAFVEIGERTLEAEMPDDPRAYIRYYSNSPTYRNSRVWLRDTITAAVHEWRFDKSGLNAEKVGWALQATPLEQLGLVERDPLTGEIVQAEKIDKIASVLIPILLVVLLFMVIMMGAGPLIQSVLEEKMQRIAEVLLGSIDPFAWMMGKLLGVVGVSLTIVLVYLGGGLVFAQQKGLLDLVPLHLLGWFAAYQILAILMFGSVFIAVGSACNDHREAQTALTPLMLLIMVPMFLLESVLREPNSAMATWLSFFPPLTPVLMLIRQAVPPGVPGWQPILAIILVLLTTVACVFAAGRVFRVGMLMQGKGAGIRDLLRWIIKG